MIFRVISFTCVPVFMWLLIRSYKQIRKEYDKLDNIDFLFNIFWFIGLAWGVISLFLYAFFDISIVPTIKHW